MIRRLFWLGVGVGVGVIVVRRLTRTAQSYTPQGVAASVQDSAVRALDSVRIFVADVREAMAIREAEIHAAISAGAPVDGEHLTEPGHTVSPGHAESPGHARSPGYAGSGEQPHPGRSASGSGREDHSEGEHRR